MKDEEEYSAEEAAEAWMKILQFCEEEEISDTLVAICVCKMAEYLNKQGFEIGMKELPGNFDVH